jgi:hypothetical protein
MKATTISKKIKIIMKATKASKDNEDFVPPFQKQVLHLTPHKNLFHPLNQYAT